MLLRYRGREGMYGWLFHRISGIAIWAFVILHVIDIYLVGGNPDAYDELLTIYALVHALTINLPAVTSVQLLVDGKEVDTLAGHVDLRRPSLSGREERGKDPRRTQG